MSWTEERVEILKKLWSEGLSASQIATAIGGVSRNAVIGKVHRLKLAGRAKTGSVSAAATVVAAKNVGKVSLAQTATKAADDFLHAEEHQTFEPVQDPKPVDLDASAQDVSKERRISLLELTEATCKWPTGDPLVEGFYFCGAEAESSSPYCKHHSKIAFQAISERRRKAH